MSVISEKKVAKKEDYYLSGEHPLNGAFDIQQAWTTPIGKIKMPIAEDMRKALIEYVASKGYCSTMGTHARTQTKEFEQHHYNMFEDSKNNKFIEEFENYSNELIRYYVANSWGIKDADQLEIEARAFGNLQTFGSRTYPHYHHAFDGVFVHYLTLGDEFDTTTVDGKNFYEGVALKEIEPGSTITAMESGKDEALKASFGEDVMKNHPTMFEESGNLLLQDPRPAINFPYNNKAMSITPEVGLTVFHPGYIWHESNTYTGAGLRAAIIVNFRVLTKNNSEIVKPLDKIM